MLLTHAFIYSSFIGPLLAKGYLNNEEMTNTRFPMNKSVPTKEKRLYRSGDLAKLLPDGTLEILGRCNFMVKIRGYTVVPGAVEAVKISLCHFLPNHASDTNI